ncbi:hypothetical protein AVEN_151467-1 [Araneus ventricosus]|uniref:Uncharacterized protein n=1 Tax=Araneus ventricosus TaxID=182803 RepID=A0A4Y2KAI7_ARAVE|nr:hypothetical protein AVEN_151467-1 [Araneus ventricosus]
MQMRLQKRRRNREVSPIEKTLGSSKLSVCVPARHFSDMFDRTLFSSRTVSVCSNKWKLSRIWNEKAATTRMIRPKNSGEKLAKTYNNLVFK